MTIYYDLTSQFFFRSNGHIPQAWEMFHDFEDSLCWNCGGEFTIERRVAGGWMEHKPCWTCGATGVLSTSVETVEYNPEWVSPDNNLNISLIGNAQNAWEAF